MRRHADGSSLLAEEPSLHAHESPPLAGSSTLLADKTWPPTASQGRSTDPGYGQCVVPRTPAQ
jgi:hypothetical protein